MPVNKTWEETLGDVRAHAYRAFFELSRELLELLTLELASECQLEISWYDVLLHLDEAPTDRMGMTELANAVVITKGGLTKLIDRMESAGLVRRMPSPSDRRAIDIERTDVGRARFEAAATVHRRGIVEHFVDHITTEEARVLVRAFGRVHAALTAESAASS